MHPLSKNLAAEVTRLRDHLRRLEREQTTLAHDIQREEKRHADHYALKSKRDKLRRKIAGQKARNNKEKARLVSLRRVSDVLGEEAEGAAGEDKDAGEKEGVKEEVVCVDSEAEDGVLVVKKERDWSEAEMEV